MREDAIFQRLLLANGKHRQLSKQLTQLKCLQVQFNGMTPLGTNLNQKVIQPFLMGGIQTRNLSKPILVIIITDGEPTGEPKTTVAQVIKNAKNMAMNSPYGPGAIAFEFAQVGKDQAAQAFLGQLDKDPGECLHPSFHLPGKLPNRIRCSGLVQLLGLLGTAPRVLGLEYKVAPKLCTEPGQGIPGKSQEGHTLSCR